MQGQTDDLKAVAANRKQGVEVKGETTQLRADDGAEGYEIDICREVRAKLSTS